MTYRQLEAQLERVGGTTVVRDLTEAFAERPLVLLAGDQASGKSTTARELAALLAGESGSTGAIIRARAAQLGISFEELNASIDPLEDARNDLLAARAIAAGTVVVFESRLAGHLGRWLRVLGRRGILAAYLQCPPRERALRVIQRATSPEVRAAIEPRLGARPHLTFEQVIEACLEIAHPEIEAVAGNLRAAQRRDDSDRARILALYGLDYADRSVFDVVLDTSSATPADLARSLAARVRTSAAGSEAP